MATDRKLFVIDYNAACGLLEHLNVEELKDVLNDDSKFEDIIKDFKQSKEIEVEKEMLLASNRSLADFNLMKEPEIKLIKQELEELSRLGEILYKNVDLKSNKWKPSTKRPKNQSNSNTLDTTLALLQTAAAEMEEESEGVAEGFLNGTLDVEGFLEPFTTRRKLMHLRRVKADKMSEMISRRNSSVSDGGLHTNSGDVYPRLYEPPPPIAAVPYPLAPVSLMPLPSSYSIHGQF